MIDRRYGRSCAAVLLGAACAVGLARPSLGADGTPSVGPPIVLFSPSPSAATTGPAALHRTAVASAPGRRTGNAAARAPIDAKPLIPPAAAPAKPGPPPDPRPALSIETDLQPLAAPAPAQTQTPAAGTAAPVGAKPAAG